MIEVGKFGALVNLIVRVKSKLNWALFRWFTVGVLTFLIDYVLFLLCFGPINSVFIANFISGVCSTSFNYFAHHAWTFKSGSKHRQSSPRFIINLAIFWLVSTILLKGLIKWGVSPAYAKLIPILIITPFSYFILNRFVFKSAK
jgi:putative flippase GtrA